MTLRTLICNKTVLLYSATVGSTLLGVGTSILTTHYLDPVEYGNYRYVSNIINFIASLLLFGYFVSGSRLLAISKDPIETRKINGVMISILGVASFVFILLMILCYFLHYYCLKVNYSQLFLVAAPFCYAPLLVNYTNTTFQGEGRIIALALTRLLPAIVYIVIAFCYFNYIGAGSSEVIILYNLSIIIVLLPIIFKSKPIFKDNILQREQLLNENKQYGFHVYCGSILAVSFSYISAITLGLFESNNTNVGYYVLATAISNPIALLPTIVGTTHFREFASSKSMKKEVIRNTIIITLISIVLYVVIISPLVHILYPPAYDIVAKYASILAVGAGINGLGDLFNRFLGSQGKGKEIRNAAICCGVITIIGSFIFVYLWGINGAILTRIISMCVYLFLMIHYYLLQTRHEFL